MPTRKIPRPPAIATRLAYANAVLDCICKHNFTGRIRIVQSSMKHAMHLATWDDTPQDFSDTQVKRVTHAPVSRPPFTFSL